MNVGCAMETDEQIGIAHFLEHLAFCGTKHFPNGEMIEYFQRLGMKFVADTNARTEFGKTVYQLELPRASEEVTGEGIMLFRDFLDGMLLEEKEIERERSVILSEIRASDSGDYREDLAEMRFLVPDGMVSKRVPLGSIASVRSLKRQQFVDFYETWYTPSRATIVAAGDFDAKMVERLIKRSFGDAKARRGEQPDPSIGVVNPAAEISAGTFSDGDLRTITVGIHTMRPAIEQFQTKSILRADVVRELAYSMLDARLDKIAETDGNAILSSSATCNLSMKRAEDHNITVSVRGQQWAGAIGIVEQELRRALAYGFKDAELEEVETKLIRDLQAAADQAKTRLPSELVEMVVSSLAAKEVVTHPAYDLTLFKEMLAGVKKEECEKALHEIWDDAKVMVWVNGNLDGAEIDAKKIVDAYAESQKIAVEPMAEQAKASWAYTDFGRPGEIVRRSEQADLGIVQAEFANHVRVNIKRTSYEQNVEWIVVRFGGGVLEVPADKPGLKQLANAAFIGGGLEGIDIREINRITVDKKLGLQFEVGQDAFIIGGACMTQVLETPLQMCAAYLTAPGYRAEGYKQYLDYLDRLYPQMEHTLEGALGSEGFAFLHGGDPRFAMPSLEQMKSLTMEDLKAWMARPLAKGNLEISIVGDVDPEIVLQLVAKTLGALPERDAAKPDFAKERETKFPTDAKLKEIAISSQTPCGLVSVYWPTAGERDIHNKRRVAVLADVLNERLRVKVRKELGATYTPSVNTYTSVGFLDYGYLEALLTVDPQRVAEIGPLVASIGADLANGKISDDEFERAMKPTLAALGDLNNGYWLNALADCQEHPQSLENVRSRTAEYQSMTKAEIETLAKQLLAKDKATTIVVTPKAPQATETSATELSQVH
jgi:zinc protease